jgi:hypothetical protein
MSVLRFAKSNGYENVLYIGKWKGWDIFEPILHDGEISFTGVPLLIMKKGSIIKISTAEEAYEQQKTL